MQLDTCNGLLVSDRCVLFIRSRSWWKQTIAAIKTPGICVSYTSSQSSKALFSLFLLPNNICISTLLTYSHENSLTPDYNDRLPHHNIFCSLKKTLGCLFYMLTGFSWILMRCLVKLNMSTKLKPSDKTCLLKYFLCS